MSRCQIALGGNLGDVSATFQQALGELDASPGIRVVQVSNHHRTQPVGEAATHVFLNAAAELETDLAPAELLARLHQIEDVFGRRRIQHWGPRTLDLDLLLYENNVLDTPSLQVPHPACWYRRFVLDPLAEICPNVKHPTRQLTVAQLRQRLLLRPLPIALAGELWTTRGSLITFLDAFRQQIQVVPWPTDPAAPLPTLGSETSPVLPDAVPAIVFWSAQELHSDSLGSAAEMSGARGLPRASELQLPADASAQPEFVRGVLQAALGR